MRIKATGTVTENLSDGRKVKVAWDPPSAPRDWYFYTYRITVVEADIESETGRRLIDFTFGGEPQDYAWFLERPYWAEKYGVKLSCWPFTAHQQTKVTWPMARTPRDLEEEPTYTVDTIIAEGMLSYCCRRTRRHSNPMEIQEESYTSRAHPAPTE